MRCADQLRPYGRPAQLVHNVGCPRALEKDEGPDEPLRPGRIVDILIRKEAFVVLY
jgi:hypothetical protein